MPIAQLTSKFFDTFGGGGGGHEVLKSSACGLMFRHRSFDFCK